MKNLTKENYGDLKELKKLGENKKNKFTIEQLLDQKLKNSNGENRIEVENRMNEAIEKVIEDDIGKKIAIISHGAAIKFWLMKWCKLNENNEIQYKQKIIKLNSPGILKILINGKNITNIKQIL